MRPDLLYRILVDVFGEEYEIRNGQFRVNCINPNCDDESGNLEISLDKGIFHCWKCGYKGIIRKLLRDYGYKWIVENEDEYVSASDLIKKDHYEVRKERSQFQGLPEEYEYLGDESELSYVGQKAQKYALTRMTLDDIRNYRVGYCGFGNYKWRIVVPIHESGKAVYFVSRAFFKDVKPPYKNPEKEECGVGKEEVVFNLDSARERGRAVICEGVFDAIRVGGEGVAIFGTSLSATQGLKILDAVKKVCVMLDQDAIDKSIQIARNLKFLNRASHAEVSMVVLPKGDPNDWPSSELQRQVSEAVPLSNHDLDRLEEYLKN